MLLKSTENKYNLINETNTQWVVKMSEIEFYSFSTQKMKLVSGLSFDVNTHGDTDTQQIHKYTQNPGNESHLFTHSITKKNEFSPKISC